MWENFAGSLSSLNCFENSSIILNRDSHSLISLDLTHPASTPFSLRLMFHLNSPLFKLFALANNLLWHVWYHLCSTLFNLICPCSVFFTLANHLLWHLMHHVCSSLFDVICPYSIECGSTLLHLFPPFPV